MIEQQRTSLFGTILPKTLAGVAVWVLLIGVGMAASGVAFFAFYQYKLSSLEQKIDDFSVQFDKDFKQRSKEFTALVKDSKAEIEKASRGAGRQTNEVEILLKKIGPSISYVRGEDAAGAPATGSGFIVTSNPTESWIITNYRTVAGAAVKRIPVKVRLAGKERDATVWSWDEGRDLALLILKEGNLPVLDWEVAEPQIGSRVWAVGTGPGKLKSVAAAGYILDNAPDGLLVDADVTTSSSGGPLVSRGGRVLGVLTLNYAPEGFVPSNGWAVPIRLSCQKIIRCPDPGASPAAKEAANSPGG